MNLKPILREISAYERTYKKWEERSKKIVARYTGETLKNKAQFNILWSNVETLIPAVFARLPQPEVTRRFKDRDSVGRVAALILERGLEYEIQHYDDYRASIKSAVKDRFLGGRGVCWVRYEPKFQEEQTQISEDAEERVQVIDYECAPVDYVHWKDFGHQCARSWEEVKLVWRKVYMTYDELAKRFGEEVADGTPMDQKPSDLNDKEAQTTYGRQVAKATVYEVWHKDEGAVIWLSKGRETPLDVKPDPLGLVEFWPCPKPLLATTTTDSLVPVPDYTIYQDQADELDLICDRIDGLIRALKVVGVYDATQTALRRLLDEGTNGTMIPVDSWTVFSEKGGLKNSVDFLPLDQVVKALLALYEARDQIKAQIYEITGISDIIRGQSKASETATAQEIKGRFASIRLRKMQEEVAEFCKAVLRIKAQIICKHFQPQTIALMSGAMEMQEPDEVKMQAIQLLKNDPVRGFRIEITADSLTETDEEADKQARVEFLTATGAFLEKSVAAAQVAPELMPLLGEMLMFGVRGFKVGRSIEGAFDQTMQALAQPKPPQPNPEVEKARAEMDIKAQEMQLKQQDMMARQQADVMKVRAQVEGDQMRAQSEMMLEQARAQNEMALEKARAEFQMMLDRLKAEGDLQIKAALVAQQMQRDDD